MQKSKRETWLSLRPFASCGGDAGSWALDNKACPYMTVHERDIMTDCVSPPNAFLCLTALEGFLRHYFHVGDDRLSLISWRDMIVWCEIYILERRSTNGRK